MRTSSAGFTIIETLVAITILIVAIAGPLVIASKGLSASIYARDQITAFYLAQEAIEFIRNERDSSGLRARFAAPTFVERFAECASGPCTVDIRAAEVESCDGGECPPLLFDEASGLYSYVSGDPSPFTRSVELEEVNDREIALTVTMDWTSGLLNRSFSIHGRLLEWFGEAGGLLGSGGSSSGGSLGGGVSTGGLVAHYRADDYTAGSWPDRTGNGFDLSQSTGANQPAAVSDGGFEFGNQPVVNFDGSNDFMRNDDLTLSQPLTLVAIAKADSIPDSNAQLVGGGSSSRALIFWNPQLSYHAGTTRAGSTGLGVPVLVEGYFDGASSALRANSTVETTANPGTAGLAGVVVGARYDGVVRYFDGDIAEILIYDGELTSTQRQELADYAATRYGVGQTDLVAHYRADDYTAGNWPDRTGNGFDLSQSTGANQPTAVANGGFEFNNQPVVRFDGGDDYIERTSTPALQQPFTIVAIQKMTQDSSTTQVMVGSTAGEPNVHLGEVSTNVPRMSAGIAVQGTTDVLNTPILKEAYYDGTSSVLRVNSVVEFATDVGSNGLTGTSIGAFDGGVFNWGGDIAEILIYDGPLLDTERQDLADYAATRYGVGQTDLVAHYRADDYTAGNWPDRTGNGFDLSQSTGANQPTAVANGGFEFNNQPVVRFDGGDDFLSHATTPSLAAPYTIVAIAQSNLTGTSNYMVADNAANSPVLYFDSSDNITLAASTALSGGNIGIGTHLLEGLVNGSDSAVYVDSALAASGNSGTGVMDGIRVGIRYDAVAASAFDGRIAEIRIYDGELSSSQRQELADYAEDRYGIGRTDLIAWYRADDYTAGNWPDKNGSNLTLTQGTAGNQPTAVANGGFEFNNQPVVNFDGSNDFMRNDDLTLSQPLTYVVIQKLTLENATTKTIMDGTTASNRAALAFLSNEAPVIYGGAQLDGSGSLHNVPTLIEAFYEGASSSIRVDGELNVSGSAGTQTLTDLTIGTYYDADDNWYGGDIADILIYDGPLSTDERQDILDYAAERYNVNQMLLLAGGAGSEVAAFTKSGDIVLAGTLTQNGTPTATSDDELIFKDGNGDTVALLNTVTGDMIIAGSLSANQQTLTPSSESDDIIMQDDDGMVVIYFDDSGNLYLKGDVEENANF